MLVSLQVVVTVGDTPPTAPRNSEMRAEKRNTKPEWARRIWALRSRLGMNQSALAELLGFSAMAVSRWERGLNEPPAAAYIGLGKLAGSPQCWFFWNRVGLSRIEVEKVLSSDQKLQTE